MPSLSVIVPIYNVEKYIERCVRSMFEQTLNDIEYIFIDDCTPDKSILILNNIVKEYDARIHEKNWIVRIEKMDVNSGLPTVRKYGIGLANGEYLMNCDSDDWIADSKAFERMYQKAKTENLDVVICEFFEGEENNYKKHTINSQSEDKMIINEMLCHYVPVCIWNKMIKTQMFRKNNFVHPKNNMGEDIVVTIQVAYYAQKVGYIHEPYYFYFRNFSSITKQQSEKSIYNRFKDMEVNVGMVCDFLTRMGVYNRYYDEIKILKEDCRFMLLPLIGKNKYRKEWLNVYPQLKYGVFDLFVINNRRYAMRYFLIKTNLYAILRTIKNIVLK